MSPSELELSKQLSPAAVAAAEPPPARSHALPSVAYLAGTLAGGNVASLVLRSIGVVVQGRLAGPFVMGVFGTVSLAMGYVPILQLGILNGINRELP